MKKFFSFLFVIGVLFGIPYLIHQWIDWNYWLVLFIWILLLAGGVFAYITNLTTKKWDALAEHDISVVYPGGKGGGVPLNWYFRQQFENLAEELVKFSVRQKQAQRVAKQDIQTFDMRSGSWGDMFANWTVTQIEFLPRTQKMVTAQVTFHDAIDNSDHLLTIEYGEKTEISWDEEEISSVTSRGAFTLSTEMIKKILTLVKYQDVETMVTSDTAFLRRVGDMLRGYFSPTLLSLFKPELQCIGLQMEDRIEQVHPYLLMSFTVPRAKLVYQAEGTDGLVYNFYLTVDFFQLPDGGIGVYAFNPKKRRDVYSNSFQVSGLGNVDYGTVPLLWLYPDQDRIVETPHKQKTQGKIELEVVGEITYENANQATRALARVRAITGEFNLDVETQIGCKVVDKTLHLKVRIGLSDILIDLDKYDYKMKELTDKLTEITQAIQAE